MLLQESLHCWLWRCSPRVYFVKISRFFFFFFFFFYSREDLVLWGINFLFSIFPVIFPIISLLGIWIIWECLMSAYFHCFVCLRHGLSDCCWQDMVFIVWIWNVFWSPFYNFNLFRIALNFYYSYCMITYNLIVC